MLKAITERQFAERLNMTVRTFRAMAREGSLPAPINPSSQLAKWVWSEAAVASFIAGTYTGTTTTVPAARTAPTVKKAKVGKAGKQPIKVKKPATLVTQHLPLGDLGSIELEQLADGTVKVVAIHAKQ